MQGMKDNAEIFNELFSELRCMQKQNVFLTLFSSSTDKSFKDFLSSSQLNQISIENQLLTSSIIIDDFSEPFKTSNLGLIENPAFTQSSLLNRITSALLKLQNDIFVTLGPNLTPHQVPRISLNPSFYLYKLSLKLNDIPALFLQPQILFYNQVSFDLPY